MCLIFGNNELFRSNRSFAFFGAQLRLRTFILRDISPTHERQRKAMKFKRMTAALTLLCAASILSLTACSKAKTESGSINGNSNSSSFTASGSGESGGSAAEFAERTSMFEFLPPILKPNSEDEFICEEDGVGVKITGTTAQGKALWIPDKLYGKPVLGVNLPKAEFEEVIMPDTVQIFSLNFAKLKYMNIPRNIQYDRSTDGYDMPAMTEIVLEAVYFDDGISEIKAMTVGESLKRVSLPDSLTTLGAGAFATCSGLTGLVIPDGVKKIDPTAFEDCKNIRIKYRDDIYTYDDRLNLSLECTCDENGISHTVFSQDSRFGTYEEKTYNDSITYCSRKAEKITIPANISEIGHTVSSPENVFYYCDKLQSIEVDPANKNFYAKDGVLFQKGDKYDTLLAYPNAKPDKSYTVPDNVGISHSIGGITPFSNCLYLQNLEVSSGNERYRSKDGVLYGKDETSDGKKYLQAFPGGRTEYELPDSVLGSDILAGARSLKNITVSETNELFSSKGGVLYMKTSGAIIVYPRGKTDAEFTLPDDSNYENLSESRIFVNPYLKAIIYKGKSYAPGESGKLIDDIKYGESGVQINSDGTVTGISDYAEEIVIPDNVTGIDDDVFSNREKLKSIKYKNKTYTRDNLNDLYAAVRGEEGLTITSDGKLTKVSPDLTEVKIPDRVTEIARDKYNAPIAFKECGKLKKVTFGKGVTCISGDYTISPYIFINIFGGSYNSDCNSVEEMIISEGVTEVGDSAFAELTKLKTVVFPNSLKYIGVGAFLNCTSLKEIAIPDSVTSIAAPTYGRYTFPGAFDSCTNIKATYKGKTYDYAHIDDLYKAINGNENSSAVTGGEGLTIENGVVVDADEGISRAVIPQGVKQIGADAFSDCTQLTEVLIPDTVTFIGAYAFNNCTSLRELTLPDSVTECQIVKGGVREPHPFYNCSDLKITYKGKTYTNTDELYAAVNGS